MPANSPLGVKTAKVRALLEDSLADLDPRTQYEVLRILARRCDVARNKVAELLAAAISTDIDALDFDGAAGLAALENEVLSLADRVQVRLEADEPSRVFANASA